LNCFKGIQDKIKPNPTNLTKMSDQITTSVSMSMSESNIIITDPEPVTATMTAVAVVAKEKKRVSVRAKAKTGAAATASAAAATTASVATIEAASEDATSDDATSSEEQECQVCYDKFNLSNRKAIVCEFGNCKNKICRECARSYILGCSNEPHCMACKRSWSPAFLLNLNKSWLKDTYRTHREKLLCDIEISKLPETMQAAERYKEVKREEKVLADLKVEENELFLQVAALRAKTSACQTKIFRLTHGAITAAEKKVFFMPCPQTDCNGMLSTQYKCGICELFTCPDCHEIIGMHKTDEHTCDPNNVASALAIKKETRQCPGCPNRIYRIEGCSQMWCTGCHTAFDWNTGRKVIGEQLHNPHWVEYQRSTLGQAPRAPGDMVCGGICTWRDFDTRIIRKLNANVMGHAPADSREKNIINTIQLIYRVVDNITRNELRTTRERVQTLRDFERERVRYIVGELTKAELSTHIYRSDRLRQKHTEILHIIELLSAVGIEVFNRLINSVSTGENFVSEVEEQIAVYDNLRIYCNGLCAIISNTYSLSVMHINDKWQQTSEKFSSKTVALGTPAPKKDKKPAVEASVVVASAAWTPTVPVHANAVPAPAPVVL
jgi:hypothetical protein